MSIGKANQDAIAGSGKIPYEASCYEFYIYFSKIHISATIFSRRLADKDFVEY